MIRAEDFFDLRVIDIPHPTTGQTLRKLLANEEQSLGEILRDEGSAFYPFMYLNNRISVFFRAINEKPSYVSQLKFHTYLCQIHCRAYFDFTSRLDDSTIEQLVAFQKWLYEIRVEGLVSIQSNIGKTKAHKRIGRLYFPDNASLVLFKLSTGSRFTAYHDRYESADFYE